MTRFIMLVVLFFAGVAASAQPQHPSDAERERRAAQREFGQGYDRHHRYPRWCQGYDRHDYWRERRECGRDWECRARVNRKAERCGLKG